MAWRRPASRTQSARVLGVALAATATAAAVCLGAALYGCSSGGAPSGSSGPSSSDPPAARPASATLPTFTRLARSAHPLARPEYDVGALDVTRRIANLSLVFKPSAAQIADRDALREAQLDPGSPSYHKWLTPEQYAARFGAQPADVARATAWLAAQGLEVHEASPLGARVTFSGTVGALQAAFKSEMHGYRVNGESHFAMAQAPSIPSELADVVLALHNTHDFYPKADIHLGKTPVPDSPCTGIYCGGAGIAPPDWTAIYDVNKLYSPGLGGKAIDGTGITIAIVGISKIAQGDINAFRTKYGLPATTVNMTLVPNTGAGVGANGAGIEAILDTEWAGGIAKGATIDYIYTGASDGNVDDAVYYAIEHDTAGILSESFGGCEAGIPASDADITEIYGSAANVLGITYLAASGDAGAATCERSGGTPKGLYVSLPAAFPGITSVGGTEFPTGSLSFTGPGQSAAGYSTSETTWNESSSASGPSAGGGGLSNVFARPSYQQNLSTCSIVGSLPTSVTPSAQRQVPDLSFAAAGSHNGIIIECTFNGASGDCSATAGTEQMLEIGGTSASTPAFAGVVALAQQATGGGRLGNVNPLLYKLATTPISAFHDIQTGNNEVKCTAGTDPGCPAGGAYGYPATAGYDCATGLGSADVYNLVNAWSNLAPTTITLTPSPTTTTAGGSVDLSAAVSATGSNGNAIGGNVTFRFKSYLANGLPDMSWTLGEAGITGGSSTAGAASLSGKIPAGLVNPAAQYVDVFAEYGGDDNHLASYSAPVRIDFAPISYCISPGSKGVAAGATIQFTSAGGTGATRWFIAGPAPVIGDTGADTTCVVNGSTGATTGCSSIGETTGLFTAGTGQSGYVMIWALDASGAETFARITVGSPAGAAPYWMGDAGYATSVCTSSGVDAGVDAGGGGTDSGTTVADSGSGADSGGTASDSGTTVADSGGGTDSGGTTSDSGTVTGDAGSHMDAGLDSGKGGTDSGVAANDSGTTTPVDSGTTETDSGADAAVAMDSSTPPQDDSGAADAAEEGDAGSAPIPGNGGGCGCVTAGSSSQTGALGLLAFALPVVVVIRRRRRR